MTPEIDTLRAELKTLKQRHEAGELGEADWHAARAPLERRLADLLVADETPAAAPRPSRALVAGVVAFVLVVAAGGYAITGEPRAVDPAVRAAAPPEGGGVTREQIVAMVERLAERMKTQPDDPEGWTMLGLSRARAAARGAGGLRARARTAPAGSGGPG
jgi:cytochrome c-type biogenesis protein CcmH